MEEKVKTRQAFIHALGLYTFICFLLQIAGFRHTAHKKLYLLTTLLFGLLFFLYLILALLLAIVPTGPFV